MYSQTIIRKKNIIYKGDFKKIYKFKINLLLLTKLIIFLNLNKLGN